MSVALPASGGGGYIFLLPGARNRATHQTTATGARATFTIAGQVAEGDELCRLLASCRSRHKRRPLPYSL